ncbi:MAG: 3D domain-containing protein [Coriobacteriia bacterium]
MGRLPGGPARFQKTHYAIAAAFVVAVAILCITGFVWANKGVTLVVDGRAAYHKTQASDVAGLLSQTGVRAREGDIVSPVPATRLRDGMKVVVRHAVPVRLEAAGKRFSLRVIGTTVADALVAAGLDPGSGLHVSPAIDARLVSGMTITATDVFLRVIEHSAVVPFKTVKVDDPELAIGTRRVVVRGVAGRVLRIFQALVVDGRQGALRLRAQRVVEAPIDEVVAVGTKRVVSRQVASRVPARVSAAAAPSGGTRLRVDSTAYAPGGGAGNHTATGAHAGYGIVAVDPDVIPLGTRVYIPGYGYAVAADTGSAIRGNRIDVCFDTVREALAWGRRSVTIVVLP